MVRQLLFSLTIAALLFHVGCHRAAAPATESSGNSSPAPLINDAALEKLGWKLSCQAYTFRALTLFETLDILHNLGIHYVELFPGQKLSPQHEIKADHNNLTADLLAQLKGKLRETGITAVNYGVVPLPNDEKESRKVFDFAKSLGLLTIVSEPPEEAFGMLDRLANEYQINVAVHNHPQPSPYWNPDTVLKVCQGRSSRIGACADVGHWYRSGLVSLDCVKKLDGRIISFHVKDLDKDKNDVIWGTGVVDLPGILREAQRQGLHPVFSIEYESTKGQELIDNVTRSIQFFSDYATGLAK